MSEYLSVDEIKQEEVQLLLEFKQICQEHGLRFVLVGGTLLGAVRHKGFIPWDDDIDVGMPRPDFQAFVQLFHEGLLPQNRSLEVVSGNDEHPEFVKYVHDQICAKSHFTDVMEHLWIDVFPIDGLPSDNAELASMYRKAHIYQRLLWLSVADTTDGKSRLRKRAKQILVPIAKRLRIGLVAAKGLEELGLRHSFEGSAYVGIVAWGLYGTGERYPKSGFDPLVEVQFEGYAFPAVNCWDEYLRGIYGDYMKLPPAEKRISNHDLKVWRI